MPSENNRNREIEQQKLEKSCIDNDSNQLAVAAVDNIRNRIERIQDDFFLFPINCSICDGNICYESQDGRITFQLPCGCKFGKVCIDSWILINARCPECYVKVDHDLIFRSQPELRRYTNELVYEKARQNALEKIGICREVAGCTIAASEKVSDVLTALANSAAKCINSGKPGAGIEVQHRSFQIDNITHSMDSEESNKLTQNVKVAKVAAGAAVAAATATGYVANAVGNTFWVLGSLLAPTVRATSKQVLTEWNVEDEKADHIVDGAMEIVKAAVLSTGNVVKGFKSAGAVVGSSLARMNEHNHVFQTDELDVVVSEMAADVPTA